MSSKVCKSSVKQSMQQGQRLTRPRGLGWLLLLLLCRAWRARVRDSTAESRRHLALLTPVGLTRWKGPSVKGLLPSPGPARWHESMTENWTSSSNSALWLCIFCARPTARALVLAQSFMRGVACIMPGEKASVPKLVLWVGSI